MRYIDETTLNEGFQPFRLFDEAVESVGVSLYELGMETVIGRKTVEQLVYKTKLGDASLSGASEPEQSIPAVLCNMGYTLNKRLENDFDVVVESTISALGDEGFGVLCDIDVQATLREKLDEEFRRYRILGACNPALAHQALNEELELGALLPCNVVVYEADDGDIVVSAVDPGQLVGVANNPALDSIAQEVEERFKRVLDSL